MACSAPKPPGSTAKACSGSKPAPPTCCSSPLRKSEALFSPSTRYRDLALGPTLFHRESQSTTTASSPTGQRYIHHATRGSRVLLYRCAEACGLRARTTQTGWPPRRPHRTVRVPGVCPLRKPRRRAADGDPLAAGAGDPGGVVARLLCCTPAVAWHSGGVGGLRGGWATGQVGRRLINPGC